MASVSCSTYVIDAMIFHLLLENSGGSRTGDDGVDLLGQLVSSCIESWDVMFQLNIISVIFQIQYLRVERTK